MSAAAGAALTPHGVGRWLVAGVLVAALATAVVLALAAVLPPGYDMVYFYHPTVRAWQAGETLLYDRQTAGFFSPPWTAWLLAPLGLLDIPTAMAVLFVASAAAIPTVALAQARRIGAPRPLLLAVLATAAPYTLQVLFVGSLDGISLLGLYLAYRAAGRGQPLAFGAAMMLAAIRPQNLVLTGAVLTLWTLRHWWISHPNPRALAGSVGQTLVVPAAVVLGTAIAFGFDWPLRWLATWRDYPPIPYLITSTYAATNQAGISPWPVAAGMLLLAGYVLWRTWRGAPFVLELSVAANAALAPYMLSQSYTLLLALPWMLVVKRRPLVGAALYLMGAPLLLRPLGQWDRVGLWDVCFPLLMVVALLWSGRRGWGDSVSTPPVPENGANATR